MTTLKQLIKADRLELRACLEQSPQPRSLTLAKTKHLRVRGKQKNKESREEDREKRKI